ncbi:glutamine-hydrolyzing carbamoyl-phosphate synthase small subunit [Candidatus Sumerlaeota bacterium]|nr:glutamine-hydrolyzing carbamoyl-phosphate synthase small subunit [Candidatus Sumerlaeota bacterium]
MLEDGVWFEGTGFGKPGETVGEVVFNTSMTGYQEILTDPSYFGQMVTMTYPLIGNYGATPLDEESARPQARALIVKELSQTYSNWRGEDSLDAYLRRAGVVGLTDIDTRALVLHLRNTGAKNGVLSTEDMDLDSLRAKARAAPKMAGLDLAQCVTCEGKYEYEGARRGLPQDGRRILHVVAYDFGMKRNICDLMRAEGFRVTVVPARATAEEALALEPDGIFLSNGPGDPEPCTYAIEAARELIQGGKPTFGICLGHQIMGLALGGKTYKLKFGHRGANHPVRDEATGRIEITSQNHGFCVDADSLDPSKVEITHWNLNDMTVEGLRHKELPAFSVQYHPEASPGPHDASYLFPRFRKMIEENLLIRMK